MQWTRDLYHFETSPPPDSWEKISFELDNDVSELRKNLRAIEVTPPPTVWATVQKELDGETEIKVIPWYYRPSRWVGAAGIAGIVFVAAYLVNNQKDFVPADISTSLVSAESTAINPAKKIPTEISIAPSTPSSAPTSQNLEKAYLDKQQKAQSVTEEKVYSESFNIVPRSTSVQYAKLDENIVTEEITIPKNIHDNRDYRMIKTVQFHDGNYIQVVSADGNTTKVSYKLQSMIPAIKQDITNNTIEQWKSKLQSATFMNARVDLFDITDMVKLLSE